MRSAFAVAIVAVGLAVVPAEAGAACKHAAQNPNDVTVRRAKTATLCLLNKVRHRYFAHGDFVGRIRRADYLSGAGTWSVGENIAWGSYDYATPRSIVRSWMHSPGHRANILSRRFREIGIGITLGAPVSGMDRAATYATDFGTRF